MPVKPISTSSLPKLCVAAVLSLSVTACNPVRPPLEARGEQYPRSQVDFADESLRDNVVVEQPIVRRDEFGLLHVTVPLRADTSDPMAVEDRVTFLDADGAELSTTTWFAKRLKPHVFDRITFNSTTPRAEDFQLSLKYAR